MPCLVGSYPVSALVCKRQSSQSLYLQHLCVWVSCCQLMPVLEFNNGIRYFDRHCSSHCYYHWCQPGLRRRRANLWREPCCALTCRGQTGRHRFLCLGVEENCLLARAPLGRICLITRVHFLLLLFPSLILKGLMAGKPPSLPAAFTECIWAFDSLAPPTRMGHVCTARHGQSRQFKLNDFLALQIILFKNSFIRRNMKQRLKLSR